MLLNYDTILVGERSLLVPYRKVHVEKYHEWMTDPQMLVATGSEPLTLEEEFEMQQTWRDDSGKCTFIVLDRSNAPPIPDEDSPEFCENSLEAMAGDVNLFLSDIEASLDSDADPYAITEPIGKQAEIDIMIAEKSCQGKGLGKEACVLMMMYGTKELDVQRFFCKINSDNDASLSLFKKLGFVECAYAECFKQYEYELKFDSALELASVVTNRFSLPTTQKSFRCPQTETSAQKELL